MVDPVVQVILDHVEEVFFGKAEGDPDGPSDDVEEAE